MQSRITRDKNQKTNCRTLFKKICNLTEQYGIYTIEFRSPRTFHGKYVIQTDDIDSEFPKVFTEYNTLKAYNTKIYREQIKYLLTKFFQ